MHVIFIAQVFSYCVMRRPTHREILRCCSHSMAENLCSEPDFIFEHYWMRYVAILCFKPQEWHHCTTITETLNLTDSKCLTKCVIYYRRPLQVWSFNWTQMLCKGWKWLAVGTCGNIKKPHSEPYWCHCMRSTSTHKYKMFTAIRALFWVYWLSVGVTASLAPSQLTHNQTSYHCILVQKDV